MQVGENNLSSRYPAFFSRKKKSYTNENMNFETNIEKCFVYYESIKRELKRRPLYECRCDERLKTKVEGSTRLTYTGLIGGLEHLKIEMRLIDERFASVMGECVTLK